MTVDQPDRVPGRVLLPMLAMASGAAIGAAACWAGLLVAAQSEHLDPISGRVAFWGGFLLLTVAVWQGQRTFVLGRSPGRYVIVLEHRMVNRYPMGSAFQPVPKGPQPTHWLHLIDAGTDAEVGWVRVSGEDAHHLEAQAVVALWGRLRERSTIALSAPDLQVWVRGVRPKLPLEGGVEGMA